MHFLFDDGLSAQIRWSFIPEGRRIIYDDVALQGVRQSITSGLNHPDTVVCPPHHTHTSGLRHQSEREITAASSINHAGERESGRKESCPTEPRPTSPALTKHGGIFQNLIRTSSGQAEGSNTTQEYIWRNQTDLCWFKAQDVVKGAVRRHDLTSWCSASSARSVRTGRWYNSSYLR